MVTTNTTTDDNAAAEPVWRYKGYELRPSEFSTAMVHFYRAEVTRSNIWRTRLDNTTNWAVITTGASISFVLSSNANHHSAIILNTILITLFLWIEARRYRYYELWSLRVRHLETDFFAAMLVPPFAPHSDWAESLAHSLLQPEFPISMLEAFGRRLRRNYIWIYVVLGAAWIIKIYLHPVTAASTAEFITRAAIGSLSGSLVITAGAAFFGALALLALLTIRMARATGEVLPKFTTDIPYPGGHPWRVPGINAQRKQYLVWIITNQPEPVSRQIMKQMQRGVTQLPGKGMFTGQERSILMVALGVTEIAEIKSIVIQEDRSALIVVTPAQEILGRNFIFDINRPKH